MSNFVYQMNDFPLFPGLGRSLTDHEVARYLGVDVRLVRKYFARLGGMRLGRKFVFFERAFSDAVQRQIGLGGPGEGGRPEAQTPLQDQERGFAVGSGSAKGPALDLHGVLA